MPFMKSLASMLMATVLFAGCQNDKLEERVKKLEDQNAKYAEMLATLQDMYTKQKQQAAQQQQQREDSAPAEDAVFAVDIADDIANHQVEGPNSATVTIVEAWDFA